MTCSLERGIAAGTMDPSSSCYYAKSDQWFNTKLVKNGTSSIKPLPLNSGHGWESFWDRPEELPEEQIRMKHSSPRKTGRLSSHHFSTLCFLLGLKHKGDCQLHIILLHVTRFTINTRNRDVSHAIIGLLTEIFVIKNVKELPPRHLLSTFGLSWKC